MGDVFYVYGRGLLGGFLQTFPENKRRFDAREGNFEMIISWGEPYEIKPGLWELKIKVQGEKEIYDQIVTFQALKSAQEYIGFLELAVAQRKKRESR